MNKPSSSSQNCEKQKLSELQPRLTPPDSCPTKAAVSFTTSGKDLSDMERLKIQSLLSALQLHRPELPLANTGQPNKVFPPPPSPLKQRDTSFYLNWRFPELPGSLISTHQVLQYSHRGGRKLSSLFCGP